jgi:hypothetical protein
MSVVFRVGGVAATVVGTNIPSVATAAAQVASEFRLIFRSERLAYLLSLQAAVAQYRQTLHPVSATHAAALNIHP